MCSLKKKPPIKITSGAFKKYWISILKMFFSPTVAWLIIHYVFHPVPFALCLGWTVVLSECFHAEHVSGPPSSYWLVYSKVKDQALTSFWQESKAVKPLHLSHWDLRYCTAEDILQIAAGKKVAIHNSLAVGVNTQLLPLSQSWTSQGIRRVDGTERPTSQSHAAAALNADFFLEDFVKGHPDDSDHY